MPEEKSQRPLRLRASLRQQRNRSATRTWTLRLTLCSLGAMPIHSLCSARIPFPRLTDSAGSSASFTRARQAPVCSCKVHPSLSQPAGCEQKASLKRHSLIRNEALPLPPGIAFATAPATAKLSKPLILTPSPTFSVSSFVISWAKAATTSLTKISALISKRWKVPAESTSLSGRPAPSASASSAISTAGMAASIPCALAARPASGNFSFPSLGEGAIYKYEVIGANGAMLPLKADPYAFRAELRPNTGSVVVDLDSHVWTDHHWIAARSQKNWLESPISVYEVHLGSWRRVPEDSNRWLTYRELGDQLIPYVKDLGYTHIELLPIMEHPVDGSWGYQTIGYFAATSRYGSPAEFMEFVDRCHHAGIGVFLDWTPAHFPRDTFGLAEFDGTHLYEHSDPRQGTHPDWGTLVYNYGRNEVQNYLISNALFWLDKYHIDGLRVDAVASMLYLDYSRKAGEWIPNEFGGRENLHAISFLKRMNEVAHGRFPGILTIAEESTSWPSVTRPTYLGGLGFSLKWNMGWMNDTLKYFSANPVHRKYEHNKLTFSMLYAFSENFMLPFSHDEVVHGKNSLLHKMPGDLWQQFANLRLLLAYQCAHPGKKLLFMGQELAQRGEWYEASSLDWHLLQYDSHKGVQNLVRDLNKLIAAQPALHEVDFKLARFRVDRCQ